MPKDIFLSLICTTVDRIDQIKYLIQTIQKQEFDLSKIQIIVIDQSSISLEKEITPNSNITFIKSEKIGLSKARNLGLKFAEGEVIGFPDDDCFYEQDLFKRLHQLVKLKNNIKSSFWQFPIFAIENNKSVGRHWGKNSKNINSFNMYNNIASAGMFILKEDIAHQFDETLGVGSEYPSCEDLIFFWQNIVLEQKPALYIGAEPFYIRHPENSFIDIKKIKNYNKGHIEAWKKILKKSNFINKLFLILYVAFSFFYHFCAFFYFEGDKSRARYHKFVFIDRIKLLKK